MSSIEAWLCDVGDAHRDLPCPLTRARMSHVKAHPGPVSPPETAAPCEKGLATSFPQREGALKRRYSELTEADDYGDNGDDMSSPPKRPRQDDQASLNSAYTELRNLPSLVSSTAKSRANSLTRIDRATYAYARPPLRFKTRPDHKTPQEVLSLMKELPLAGIGIIPGTLKETIAAAFPFDLTPEYAFDLSASNNSDRDKYLWEMVRKFLDKAHKSFEGEPEAT
ncbi:uncharacterized protein K452DRAFT_292320, partial [Aplosporella prunicola CBS 121167]